MRRMSIVLGSALLGSLMLTSAPVDAAPGDLLRVTGERVNLRAGPSDSSNVRAQVVQGEDLIELARDGSWYGVRVLRTGEEGWIFSELVEPTMSTTLYGAAVPHSAGFSDLSRDFDVLMGNLSQRLGHHLVSEVVQGQPNELRVRYTEDWMRAGSSAEHLLAATAIYQMWKNHQNSAPVRVAVLDPAGNAYMTIDETVPSAPLLTIARE